MCIEESFDTIFNMGCGGGGRKLAMAERVKGGCSLLVNSSNTREI